MHSILPPDLVAGSDQVSGADEDLERDPRGDAGAVGRVLASGEVYATLGLEAGSQCMGAALPGWPNTSPTKRMFNGAPPDPVVRRLPGRQDYPVS